jgi:cyclase
MYGKRSYILALMLVTRLVWRYSSADEQATIKIDPAETGTAEIHPVEVHPVAANIHMLVTRSGNIGVFSGNDGSFLIDDQFAPLTATVIAAIEAIGIDMPRYLLNTHFHDDHSGGLENLGRETAAMVSHHSVRARLNDGYQTPQFGIQALPPNQPALPNITYSHKTSLQLNGDNIDLIHVANAHSENDSFVVFENANVVHAGDLFFNGLYPFIDAAEGGSLSGLIAGIDKILERTDSHTRIIPGHGPLADRAQLLAYRSMLITARHRLQALKASGLSAEQAAAKQPLEDLEPDWGNDSLNSEKWIKTIYSAVD